MWMECKVRGRVLKGCGWLGLDRGGPCKLVRSLAKLYSEIDTEVWEGEMVKCAGF